MSFDDPFGELDAAEALAKQKKAENPKRARTQRQQFADALPDTTHFDVAKAAQRKTVKGNYWVRSLRLPPEYRELTREIYRQEPRAKSIAEIERWIYTMGLQAYFEHGLRPEYNETIQRDINLPRIGGA